MRGGGKGPTADVRPEGGRQPDDRDTGGAFATSDLAREYGVSPRTLRFYEAKGLLTPHRSGRARQFSTADRERLVLILQAKRLRFTLAEVRRMLKTWRPGSRELPISRKQCVEQIKLLEREHGDIERALHELRAIYTGMSMFGQDG